MAEIFKVGEIMKPVYAIEVDYEPTTHRIKVGSKFIWDEEGHKECNELSLRDRCQNCIDQYYQDKEDFEADQWWGRD